MKRKRSNLFALVVLVFTSLFLIATGSVANAGSISGQVTSGGLPLADVCVDAVDNQCNGNWYGTQTDSAGNYSITGLPEGTYYVKTHASCVTPQYYVDEWWDGADGTIDCNQAAPVPVVVGQNTPGINFSLEQGGTISGRVTDLAGNPLANICVDAVDNQCNGNWYGTQTDSAGNYSITGLPEGTYYVQANPSCDSQNYVFEWWDGAGGTIDCNQAAPVTVTAGQDTGNINFALEPGGLVSGTVTDSQGNPIPNIHVYAHAEPCGGNWLGGTNTDKNGNYTLAGLPAGDCYVTTCAHCSGLNYIDEWYDNATDCNEAVSVPVVVGQNTPGINFSLEEGGSVSGRVTDLAGNPLANICVDAVDNQCNGNWYGTQTDSAGNYSIIVPGGIYYVLANPSCDSQNYVLEWWDGAGGTIDCNQAAPVNVITGQDTPNINFSLEEGGSVSGRVTTTGGQPIANVYVDAVDNQCNGNWYGTQTDSAGNYSITGLPEGTYYVKTHASCVTPQYYVDEWWDGAGGTIDCNQAAPVAVVVGQNTPGINFSLEQGGTISGRVTDLAGNPLANICVDAVDNQCNGNWYGTRTDSAGNYSIIVPGGIYYVLANPSCDSQNYVLEWWDGAGGTIDCNQAAPVPVVVGQATPGINFELEEVGPVPDIKANGSDDPLFVNPGENVDISISLDPGDMAGEWADWWGILLSPYGTFPLFGFQCPLFELPETSLFSRSWPMGWYIFLFGLDDVPDGAFELDWYDYVVVVSQPAGAQLENIPNFDDIVKEKMRELTGE